MATSQVTVSIENLAPSNSTQLTPVWVGFHDGQFDTFNSGSPASPELEQLAEDGNNMGLSQAFTLSGFGQVDGVVGATPISPGAEASQTFTLDTALDNGRFLSYAAMVLPSNDTFIANEESQAVEIFDAAGNFVGANFIVPGSAAFDAGTEVNDEIPANVPLLGQQAANTGMDENGVVQASSGFLPADSGSILADPRFAEADFTRDGYQFARITVKLDSLTGDSSDETLIGSADDNTISGLAGNDLLRGLNGNDTLFGGLGDDTLRGGRGKDALFGDRGNDTLQGGRGKDALFGDRGNDTLRGGRGDDTLFGGQGNDSLEGGRGSDILTGGVGRDKFVLEAQSGLDIITDYQDGIDKLSLAGNLEFGSLTIAQQGDNTLIQSSDNGLAILHNVQASLITATDFV